MRRPDLDPRIPPVQPGDGKLSGYLLFTEQPRGYSCEGPGPSGEVPCPDRWEGLVVGGPVIRCKKCAKVWRTYKDSLDRKAARAKRARAK